MRFIVLVVLLIASSLTLAEGNRKIFRCEKDHKITYQFICPKDYQEHVIVDKGDYKVINLSTGKEITFGDGLRNITRNKPDIEKGSIDIFNNMQFYFVMKLINDNDFPVRVSLGFQGKDQKDHAITVIAFDVRIDPKSESEVRIDKKLPMAEFNAIDTWEQYF